MCIFKMVQNRSKPWSKVHPADLAKSENCDVTGKPSVHRPANFRAMAREKSRAMSANQWKQIWWTKTFTLVSFVAKVFTWRLALTSTTGTIRLTNLMKQVSEVPKMKFPSYGRRYLPPPRSYTRTLTPTFTRQIVSRVCWHLSCSIRKIPSLERPNAGEGSSACSFATSRSSEDLK